MTLKLIFLGDIMGKPGRTAVLEHLPKLVERVKPDFVVANAENAASGRGVTHDILKKLYNVGVSAITMGNHTFGNKEIDSVLEMDRKVVIPANYMMKTGGKGFRIFTLPNGKRVAVLNLLGQVFMPDKVHCPFHYSKDLQREYRIGDDYDAMIVDIHAEANGEKCVMGHMWDGKASLVVGTHTHLPTADAQIQAGGTAFQADAGMCGNYASSIGHTYESRLKSQFDSRPAARRGEIASGEGTMCGVYVEVGDDGLATKIQSFQYGGVLQERPLNV